jgi:hypothetical protein
MSGIGLNSKVQSSMSIEILPNDIARVVTHLQPIIYLSSFYLRFPALVADPVSALLVSLIPLALCQAVYCIVCLPAAGAAAKLPKKSQKSTIGAVKKPRDVQALSNVFVSARAAIEPFVTFVSDYKSTIARAPLPSSHLYLRPCRSNPPNPPRCSSHYPPPTDTTLLCTPRPPEFIPSLLRSWRRFRGVACGMFSAESTR